MKPGIIQVQPDLEAFDLSGDNVEDDNASDKSDKKASQELGKLHYKLDFEFQKGEVISSRNLTRLHEITRDYTRLLVYLL